MSVEAIVIDVNGKKMVLPVEVAKKLYEELGDLFAKKEKEYVPWPIIQQPYFIPPGTWCNGDNLTITTSYAATTSMVVN